MSGAADAVEASVWRAVDLIFAQSSSSSSALTYGDGAVMCGNAASALRGRRSDSDPAMGAPKSKELEVSVGLR